MPKFPTPFTGDEGFILTTLWNAPQGDHSTYTLTGQRCVITHTAEDEKAFAAIQEAVEHLYELGLLRGERLTDEAERVYFGDLKLTTKGEQETIRHRKEQQKLAKDEAAAKAVKQEEPGT